MNEAISAKFRIIISKRVFRVAVNTYKSMSNVCYNCIVKKITETRPKNHFKNEQKSRDVAAKKELYSTSGVGEKLIIIVRIFINLLTTTPTNHTYTW